jgi:hypothetical protein
LADATAAVLALGAIAGLALDGVGSIGASKERKAPPRPRVCIVAGQNCGRASTFAQVADAAFGCQIVLLTDEEVVIPRAPETWSIVRRVQDAADHGPFAAVVTLPMERDGSSSEGEELADVVELISRYTVAPGGHVVCFEAAVEGPGLRRAASLAGVSVHDFAFGSWLTSPWAGGQLRAALAVAAALLWEGGAAASARAALGCRGATGPESGPGRAFEALLLLVFALCGDDGRVLSASSDSTGSGLTKATSSVSRLARLRVVGILRQ